MIQWVYENASKCTVFSRVIVATDSLEIQAAIEGIGGEVMMTDPLLQTGSDRVASVAAHYPECPVVVNLQGDEPFIKPHMLEALVKPYLNGENPDMSTLARVISPNEPQYASPNSVKVVLDSAGYALYFSRSPIPYFRENHPHPIYHHMGLYAFKREVLLNFTQLPQTPLEKIELLEQLRLLENGYRIKVCLVSGQTLEINTPEEYADAQSFFA